jgi:tetratricopeptide (TPR) repeat protein
MKKFYSCLLAFLVNSFSYAGSPLTLDMFNAYQAQCFEQTQRVEQNVAPETLSVRGCNMLLRNTWTSRYNQSAAYLNRGIVFQYKGMHSEAIRDFVRAIKREPNNYSAHLALGQIFLTQENYVKSVYHFERALSIDDSDLRLKSKREYVLQLLKDNTNYMASVDNSRAK